MILFLAQKTVSDFSDATSTISNFNLNNFNEGQEKIYNMIKTNDSINDEKFDTDVYQSTVFKSALSTVVKMYADLILRARVHGRFKSRH
jgi:hypothetical protein